MKCNQSINEYYNYLGSSSDKQNGKMYIRENTAYPIQTHSIHDVQNFPEHQPFRSVHIKI